MARSAIRRPVGKPLTVAAAALAIGLPLLPPAERAQATGQVGEPAADFTLEGTDFQDYTLSDYRGNVVLLFMLGYL
jgi:hypothetical protein